MIKLQQTNSNNLVFKDSHISNKLTVADINKSLTKVYDVSKMMLTYDAMKAVVY